MTHPRPTTNPTRQERPPDFGGAPVPHEPGRLRTALRSPLLVLWLLGAAALIGGIGEWLFFDRAPWEGLGAAATIAGVTKLAARVKGIAAWPWEDR